MLKLLDTQRVCTGPAGKSTGVSTFKQEFPRSGSTPKKVPDDPVSKAPVQLFPPQAGGNSVPWSLPTAWWTSSRRIQPPPVKKPFTWGHPSVRTLLWPRQIMTVNYEWKRQWLLSGKPPKLRGKELRKYFYKISEKLFLYSLSVNTSWHEECTTPKSICYLDLIYVYTNMFT